MQPVCKFCGEERDAFFTAHAEDVCAECWNRTHHSSPNPGFTSWLIRVIEHRAKKIAEETVKEHQYYQHAEPKSAED